MRLRVSSASGFCGSLRGHARAFATVRFGFAAAVRCVRWPLGMCVLSNVQPLCASISPSTKKIHMNIILLLER